MVHLGRSCCFCCYTLIIFAIIYERREKLINAFDKKGNYGMAALKNVTTLAEKALLCTKE